MIPRIGGSDVVSPIDRCHRFYMEDDMREKMIEAWLRSDAPSAEHASKPANVDFSELEKRVIAHFATGGEMADTTYADPQSQCTRRMIEQRTNTTCLQTIAVLDDDLQHYGASMTNKQRAAVRTALHALRALEALTH